MKSPGLSSTKLPLTRTDKLLCLDMRKKPFLVRDGIGNPPISPMSTAADLTANLATDLTTHRRYLTEVARLHVLPTTDLPADLSGLLPPPVRSLLPRLGAVLERLLSVADQDVLLPVLAHRLLRHCHRVVVGVVPRTPRISVVVRPVMLTISGLSGSTGHDLKYLERSVFVSFAILPRPSLEIIGATALESTYAIDREHTNFGGRYVVKPIFNLVPHLQFSKRPSAPVNYEVSRRNQ